MSAILVDPVASIGERGEEQSDGAADEADDLQPDAASAVGENHSEDDADDQQEVDQRGALGGEDVVGDQVAETADMVGAAPIAAARMVGVKMPMP